MTSTGTAPSHWYRYVGSPGVKIRTLEVEAFIEHITLWMKTSSSPVRMSEDQVWPLWMLPNTQKETGGRTSRSRENPPTQTTISFSTLATQRSTSWVSSEPSTMLTGFSQLPLQVLNVGEEEVEGSFRSEGTCLPVCVQKMQHRNLRKIVLFKRSPSILLEIKQDWS